MLRLRLRLLSGSGHRTGWRIAPAALLGLSLTAQALAQDVPDSMKPAEGVTTEAPGPPSVVVPLPEEKKARDKAGAEVEIDAPVTPAQAGSKVETLPMPAQTERAISPPAAPGTEIIPDAAFDAALPPLDAPTPAGGEMPSARAASVLETGPAQAGEETADEALALPPVTAPDDVELTQALIPLQSFDVQPLQAATAPQAQTPPEITYTTSIEGLKTIGENERFKALSALRAGRGKAVNAAMVRARATEDQALALRLMKSAGYYDGTVSGTITAPPANADGTPSGAVQARILAEPGKLYTFGDITIDAPPTVPANLIRSALPLKTGDPIVANPVIAAEANVSLVLPQSGYPFASVGARDIALDPATGTGDYVLKVAPGNRARFGAITTTGEMAFDAKHIAVLKRFDQGDLYDSRKVDDLRQALISTSLFRTVAVETVATGVVDAEGVETVDLAVRQQAGPARTLAAQVGYSTGEGFTAEASWTHRNLFPPEGALIVRGALGTQEQGATVTFRRSNFMKRDRTLQLAATAEHNIYDAYQAYTAGFTGSLAQVSTPIWQKVWTWSIGLELLASREKALVTKTSTTVSTFDTYYLANIPVRLGYDRSDDLLNPTKGFRLAVSGGPQVSLGGTGASSLRTLIDGSYYYPIGPKIVIATRTRLGFLNGGALADIAPSRRLYAGGGGSVRGFAYQALGPLDSAGNPTGGQSLFEGSLEVRYRLGDIGIVPFIDMGQVFDAEVPDFSDLRVGVGVGARLYSNFGPIRIDVATPIDRRSGESQFTLYVGIGQAF